ncbi:hypothetical protein Ocin01_03068 [Orchesella cincta]|uniref:Uncharacterized protein n=1 Tax=Orchesella cincta TaxID=48709 RepID=A0A1D2NED4_ORCCI|nr:hypothetical protein Ocin01_03068 [Orchesella cincta]
MLGLIIIIHVHPLQAYELIFIVGSTAFVSFLQSLTFAVVSNILWTYSVVQTSMLYAEYFILGKLHAGKIRSVYIGIDFLVIITSLILLGAHIRWLMPSNFLPTLLMGTNKGRVSKWMKFILNPLQYISFLTCIHLMTLSILRSIINVILVVVYEMWKGSLKEIMSNLDFNQVMLNEATSTTKLTVLAFTSHVILQWAPVSTPIFLAFAWILTTFIVVLGVYYDMRFYPQNSNIGIKTTRLLTNLLIFSVSWLIALHLFPYLGILSMDDEDQVPSISTSELSKNILSINTGPFPSFMILLAHLLTTLALMTIMKVGVIMADIAFNIVILILNKS